MKAPLDPICWKTILVASDFSTCADHALATATSIAFAHDASIVLVHVCELTGGLTLVTPIRPEGSAAVVTVEEHLRTASMRMLEEQAARVVAGARSVSLRLAFGPTAERILLVAREVGADLVVIGTHGRTGLAHVLLGSIAERVVRTSPIPVLTVRHGAEQLLTLPPAERDIAVEAEG